MAVNLQSRIKTLSLLATIVCVIVLVRLFYWQVIVGQNLSAIASNQREDTKTIAPDRGKIFSRDGFALVTNQPKYTIYVYKPQVVIKKQQLVDHLTPLLLDLDPESATEAAKPVDQRLTELTTDLFDKLSSPNKWVALKKNLNKEQKDQIESLNILGVGFDEYTARVYPEGSMSAQLTGLIGRDEIGNQTGYFGLEGYYNYELKGKSGSISQETDAGGLPILIGRNKNTPVVSGRDLHTHIDRKIQSLVETSLRNGVNKYQAKAGEVIVMDPKSGAILAMASTPSYDPSQFYLYSTNLYKNPTIANTYEPGSTFKVLVMAAAIEAGVITPSTTCDSECSGPVRIGKYSIRTWNNQYNPGLNMTQVLEKSDNTGMVFVAFRLGKENFVQYLKDLGFGQKTGIDLQEESSSLLREKWGDIDVATASFGQGIAVTGIQMATAVSAIANGGYLVTPQVVDWVAGDEKLDIEPKIKKRIFSRETTDKVIQMMISSAHHGEAQWAVLKNYQIAGKTGTAQIPIDGHYDEDKTIASFVGFAPANDPKFVMLVKLTEPQTSPWAAETAAPLWFQLTQELLYHLNIPPQSK